MGVFFALLVTIFINYTTIERVFDVDSSYQARFIYPMIFTLAWTFFISMIYYSLYVVIFNVFSSYKRDLLMITVILISSVILNYILVELFPPIRDVVVEPMRRHPMGGRGGNMTTPRGLNPMVYKYVLVCILNLFFVYIQRLLYRNQEIERRNEQLQLENIKSQHSALIQQVNPHFFFNSLGSLRYIILKGDSDKAIEFLENMITIFRKTLKLSSNTTHTLQEELDLTNSYIHIIERRFEGKIFVEFDINSYYSSNYMLSPLSLLTLIENVIKHNKVSSSTPLHVKIYTTNEKNIVVENNIVEKFEKEESNGIGLINLNKQYKLLTGKDVVVYSDSKIFSVTLPLIK